VSWDPAPDPSPDELRAYARDQAQRNGINPDTYDRKLRQESGYRVKGDDGRTLTSPAGALGPAQLMPDTARGLGVDPHDWKQNIEGGARETARLQKLFGGDERAAIAAYNAGQGNIGNLVSKYGPDWEAHLEEQLGKDAPQTRQYLASILGGGSSGGTAGAVGNTALQTLPPSAVRGLEPVGSTPGYLYDLGAPQGGVKGLEPVQSGDVPYDAGGVSGLVPAGGEDVALRSVGTLRARLRGLEPVDAGVVQAPLHTENSDSPFTLALRAYDAGNVDIPYFSDAARAVQPVVGKAAGLVADNTPIGGAYNLAASGLERAGGPSLPRAGEIANPVAQGLVPVGALDLALTASPGEVRAGAKGLVRVGEAGIKEGTVRAGASRTLDRVLPSGLMRDERRGANVVEALGGTRTQGARVGQEFGPEVAGGPARRVASETPPRGQPLADVGDRGIQEALAAKKEATLEPGRVFRDEGSLQRRVVGAVNPSVDMPPAVHVANQARTGVGSLLRSELSRAEVPAYRKLATAFAEEAPAYVGPKGRPLASTWVDYAENPRFYEGTPALAAAREELRAVQDASLNRVRADFGVDVGRFEATHDPDAVYVPHMQSREDVAAAAPRTEASISSRGTVSKERAYESLSDRVAKHPDFKPELDPAVLADTHASALAGMAANNTFKTGVAGKTLTEVIDETHPGLRTARDKAAARLQAVKSRIDLAEARITQQDAALAPLIKEQAAITDRATPRFVALAEADKLTPELATMQTQVRELKIRARAIEKAVERAPGKQAAAGLRLNDALSELGHVEPQLTELRARYNSAAPGEYVRGPDFRYHEPKTAAAMETVLKTGFNNAFIDGAIEAGNTARAAGLGPDASPLTIQGALGAFSHPEVAIQNGTGLARAFKATPEEFVKSLDPQLVSRFEFASNRTLGSMGEDVLGKTTVFGREVALPGRLKGKVKGFNEALQRVVDYGTLKAFENDSNLLMKLGQESQNIADHEAANSLSKIVPRINNPETGRSVQRVKLEGLLPTSRSFTAQPFALAKDYGAALVKAARGEEMLGREKLALLRGSTLIGSLMTISVGSALVSAEANGKDPVEAVKEVLDPSSGRFLHVILGNTGSIGLGGPFRSAFLGVFRTATQGPEGVYRYAKGRLQPEIGATVDIATNRDWKGDPVREGSPWQQTLDIVQHYAQSANLLTGGVAQGVSENGVAGALTQAASGLAGVNYQERTAYDERDRVSREKFGKPYSQLFPEDKAKVDALKLTQDSDYQKRKAQVTGEIDQAERTALDAFKAGTNNQKITDIWHDLGQRRLQAAKDLSSQFAEQFKDFDSNKYRDALTGYYAVAQTFPDGTPDFEATDKARQEYIAKLPKDQQQWLNEAQSVAESKKSPERQKYDQYIAAKKQAGYMDIKPDDPKASEKRKALDAANPELDLAAWYYSGTSEKAGAGLNSPAAADKALALNLPNRPVKITGYDRPVNESPKVREVYEGTKALIENYEAALINPGNLDSHATDLYGKKFSQLTEASQRAAVHSSITRELQNDHPDLDAVLAFFGKNETLASDQAVRLLTQMVDHAGIKDPAKDKILQKVKAR